LFNVGQIVRLKSRFGVSPKTAEFYRVTGTLPPRDNSLQYRIRNDGERHERVATEDNLEPVDILQAASGTTLIKRTFGNGQGTETQKPRTSQAEAGESSAQV